MRGGVGTAFRLPTAEELFANDPQDERGDPNLRPERSFNGNVALGGHAGFAGLPGVSWEAIGFYRNVTDLISASGFDDTTMQSLFENIAGTVRVRGATAVLEVQLPPEWSGNASYTYSSSEQTDGLQIDRVPRQHAKAWLDWHPIRWPVGAMNVSASYVGDVYQSFRGHRPRALRRSDRRRRGGPGVPRRRAAPQDPAHRLSNLLGTVYAASLGQRNQRRGWQHLYVLEPRRAPHAGRSSYTYSL